MKKYAWGVAPPVVATGAQKWAASGIRGAAAGPDFYPTPEYGTRALLSVERFRGTIWEPACGKGHMSSVLEAAGYRVIATDLYDYGVGETGVDFFQQRRARARNIVTNPPFNAADEFAIHAISLLRPGGKLALLERLAGLEGLGRRNAIFWKTPPARVWVFSKRCPMTKDRLPGPDEGNDIIAFAWFVWDKTSYSGKTELGWLKAPTELGLGPSWALPPGWLSERP